MMTLYSRAGRSRAVIACGSCSPKKALEVRVVETDPARPPEDLIDLNPYQTVPTLVDRELVVYDPGIICEYLDERFPHPSLDVDRPGLRVPRRASRCDASNRTGTSLADALEAEHRRRPTRTRTGAQDARPKACSRPSRCSACGRGSCRTSFHSSTRRSRRSCGACRDGRSTSRRSARPRPSIERYAARVFARPSFRAQPERRRAAACGAAR